MINLTRQAKALRNILAALLLVLPALAQAQLNIIVAASQTPEGYFLTEGSVQYVVMTPDAALRFNFGVLAPDIHVLSASGSFTFNGQSYSLEPSINGGVLTFAAVDVPLTSAFENQSVSGVLNYTYTDNGEPEAGEQTGTESFNSAVSYTTVESPRLDLKNANQRYLVPGQSTTVTYTAIGGRYWTFTGNDHTTVQQNGNTVTVTYTATAADAGSTPSFSYHAMGYPSGNGWNIPGSVSMPVTVYPAPRWYLRSPNELLISPATSRRH